MVNVAGYAILFFFSSLLSLQMTLQQRPNLREQGSHDFQSAKWRQQQKQKLNKNRNKARTVKVSQSISDYNRQAQFRVERDNIKNISFNPFIFFEHFENLPIPMKLQEGKPNVPCTFSMAECQMEIVEHMLVEKFIQPEDGVIEFGGRFGTTSCAISAKQRNSGNLLVVEPDPSVWYILEENRRRHSCSFWTLRGLVSSVITSVNIIQASYATRAIARSSQNQVNSSTTSLDNLRSILPFKFQVLLFDCEGCIEMVFHNRTISEMRKILEDTRLIIIEGDMSRKDPSCHIGCVDYKKWLRVFESCGFSMIYQLEDPTFHNIFHFVLSRHIKQIG